MTEYKIREIARIMNAGLTGKGESRIRVLLTDSRRLSAPENSLFFAIQTKTNDGHRFIPELYRLRVHNFVVTLLPEQYTQMPDANFLVVKDTVKALQKFAAYHRKRFNIPVIGITGSNGKTVVKEFLYQLLHHEFNIVRSPRSYNSQTGVPLSVWQIDGKHTLGIFEAGISQPNEMESLEPVIAPTIGLITNLGEAHQENFISMMQKGREKLALFTNCDVIIYDGDNLMIQHCLDAACLSHKAIAWSRRDSEAPLYVESVVKEEERTVITCTLMGYSRKIVIPFTDDASIENVIHCLAVMLYLKPSNIGNTEAFAHLEPVAMRLETREGINNCRLVNDTYNSDVNSLDIALDFLQSRKGGKAMKSTLILSDILQSGTLPKSLYKRVADMVKRKQVGRIIGIGKDIVAHSNLFEMEKSFYLSTDDFIRSGEVGNFHNELILLKGSRRFHFEQISELLEKKVHETILEVNLDALVNNFNHYRGKLKPEAGTVCMVKASGYGAGAFEVAKTLQEHRCDYLAVAVVDEGVALRQEGIFIPIMVMNPEAGSFNLLFEYNLEPEVYSLRLLDTVVCEAERRGITSYPVHLKIDTGMHRLGFEPRELDEVASRLRQQSGVVVSTVFSHLAGSDDAALDYFTHEQAARFTAAAGYLEQQLGYALKKHLLNSAGVERFAEYQMDAVRLGIGLYGASPSGEQGLQPVSRLKTIVLQLKVVKAGDTVSYERSGKVERDSKIAVLPIGYADGLDRRLSRVGGEVLVKGRRCPLIGNICMDTCMIDVTDVDVREGDEVLIFGDSLPVEEIAARLDTIPYEILTSLSPRIKRVYYRE